MCAPSPSASCMASQVENTCVCAHAPHACDRKAATHLARMGSIPSDGEGIRRRRKRISKRRVAALARCDALDHILEILLVVGLFHVHHLVDLNLALVKLRLFGRLQSTRGEGGRGVTWGGGGGVCVCVCA